MILPPPGPDYDQNNEAQTRAQIVAEDAKNIKKGSIIVITKNGAVVLSAPNGTLYQISVSNAGALSAVAYTRP